MGTLGRRQWEGTQRFLCLKELGVPGQVGGQRARGKAMGSGVHVGEQLGEVRLERKHGTKFRMPHSGIFPVKYFLSGSQIGEEKKIFPF